MGAMEVLNGTNRTQMLVFHYSDTLLQPSNNVPLKINEYRGIPTKSAEAGKPKDRGPKQLQKDSFPMSQKTPSQCHPLHFQHFLFYLVYFFDQC